MSTKVLPSRRIRVVLADDHALFRQGVKALLEAAGEIEVVAEAGDGATAIERAVADRADVVVMDLTMPGMGGLEAITRLRQRAPEARALVLTMHAAEEYFFRALDAGASGYVLKEAVVADLMAAIRTVHGGQVFLYPTVATALVNDYLQRVGRGEGRDSYPRLTEREREILALIGEGRTNQEIAQELTLSVNTVQTHRSHIMEKLSLHNRAELIRYALRVGLLRNDRPAK